MSGQASEKLPLTKRWLGRGLFAGLLRSHLSLVALGSASFVVALVALFGLENRMNVALNQSEPMVEETLTVIEGVFAAGGAVNGAVALKKESYRQEWEQAWNGIIVPALDRLDGRFEDGSIMSQEQWRQVRDQLRDLHEIQWWIFDIVGRHGEESATYFLSDRIRPVMREIEESITSLIENLDVKGAGASSAFSIKHLADIRYRFTRSTTHLEAFIASGRSSAERDFRVDLVDVEREMSHLDAGKGNLELRTTIDLVERLFPRYVALAERAIVLRKGAGWSQSRELMEEKARPLERQALIHLAQMRRKTIAHANDAADEAMGAANGAIALSAGFVTVLAIAGFILSTRHARRIAAPVNALMQSAQSFALGEKVEDVFPEGYEEIAELAVAFNGMRRVVEEKKEALARSEYRFRALMEQAGDAIVLADREGRLMDANNEAARLFGRTVGEIAALTFRDLHPPEALDGIEHDFARLWREGTIRVDDTLVIRSDGARTPVSLSATLVDLGGEKIAQGIFRDMTAVKEAEEQADLFRRMVDRSGEIILLVDPRHGQVLYGNDGAAQALEYDHEQLATMTMEEILVTNDYARWWGNLMDDVRHGGERLRETVLRRKTGSLFPAELTAQVSLIGSGEFALVLARDISERLRHARLQDVARSLEEANRELKEFNAVVSHDLQSPLTTISGFSKRLLEKLSPTLEERDADFLRRIDGAARRMSDLISALLEYSWAGGATANAEEIDLGALLRGLVGDMAGAIDKSGGEVEIGALPAVYGDATLLRQAFQNLIENALKYRKPDVPPHVLIAVDPDRRSTDHVHLLVKDNGIGFDPSHADKIFRVFERLATDEVYKGTGIGLATTRKIVERHGGAISASAQPGEGATFYISLTAVAN